MSSAVLTSPSVERVRDALSRAGLGCTIVELPGAARTAKAAAEYLGCEVGQIANSLVFRAEASGRAAARHVVGREAGRPRAPRGAGRRAGRQGGRRLRAPSTPASPSAACRRSGMAAHAFVEKSLAAYRELWAAAGHPHTVFRLTYEELVRITARREADLA